MFRFDSKSNLSSLTNSFLVAFQKLFELATHRRGTLNKKKLQSKSNKTKCFFIPIESLCTLAFAYDVVAISWNRSGCVVAFIWEDVLATFLLLTVNCSPIFLLGFLLTGSGEKNISGDSGTNTLAGWVALTVG